jgi:diadenosine tetraphosphatase ApaH/serine/threonine PP2A family protein phosphatase
MIAILSCIHANLEALVAVLADAREQGAERIFCLGDVLSYGPNPIECLELSRSWDVVLLSNHDQAAMFDPDGFGQTSERASFWHREIIEQSANRESLWMRLGTHPRTHREHGLLFVHGSARNPLNEYIFPEDIYNPLKMSRIAEFMGDDIHCLTGHTHLPGLFTRIRRDWTFQVPSELDDSHQLDSRLSIINVGSVGQPRDADWRACYVLLDQEEQRVIWRRVPYDVNATIQKIYDTPELDNFLGDRLRDGR